MPLRHTFRRYLRAINILCFIQMCSTYSFLNTLSRNLHTDMSGMSLMNELKNAFMKTNAPTHKDPLTAIYLAIEFLVNVDPQHIHVVISLYAGLSPETLVRIQASLNQWNHQRLH